LEGDGFFRLKKAIDLYFNKYAPRIIFSGGVNNPDNGSFPAERVVPELLNHGIPKTDIIIENKSLNTRDQAVEVIKMVVSKKWKKIILVASHYHQYRAFLTFLKVLNETKATIEIYNAPARNLPWFSATVWGKRIDLLEKEFEKIEQYSMCGHIATFIEAIGYQKWKEEQF
jgi:uncharacterized SAM-binding protein YcdF (DUF218 family)